MSSKTHLFSDELMFFSVFVNLPVTDKLVRTLVEMFEDQKTQNPLGNLLMTKKGDPEKKNDASIPLC